VGAPAREGAEGLRRRRAWPGLIALAVVMALAAPVAADTDVLGLVSGTRGLGLRLRAEPGVGQYVLAVMPEGASVKVAESTADAGGSEWRQVSYGDVTGWVSSRYLATVTPIPTAEATRQPEATIAPTPGLQATASTPQDQADASSAGGTPVPEAGSEDRPAPSGREGRPESGSTQAIVDVALSLVGEAYSMGAAGPNAFDCAGLVYYVYAQQGIELERDAASQWQQGTPVERGDLRPGDLVFFRNTYIWGISHVGVYIGDGQFVNAVDEWTGVIISGLDESFWNEHYAGARRILP